jgi:hypothetical protein
MTAPQGRSERKEERKPEFPGGSEALRNLAEACECLAGDDLPRIVPDLAQRPKVEGFKLEPCIRVHCVVRSEFSVCLPKVYVLRKMTMDRTLFSDETKP